MRRFAIVAVLAVSVVGCAQGSFLESDSGGEEGSAKQAVPTPAPPSEVTDPTAAASAVPQESGPITAYPLGAVATFGLEQGSTDHETILIYGPKPSADSKPLATLEAPSGPGGLAAITFDAKRQLYALDYTGRISVFASGACGAAMPVRVINPDGIYPIAGPSYAYAMAVNSKGEIYVDIDTNPESPGPDSIFTYAADASGAVDPVRVISGPKTGLVLPTEIGFDKNDDVYVGDSRAFSVLVFASDANGDIPPERIACVTEGHTSMTVAPDGRLFVAPEGSSETPGWSVRVYSPKGPLLGVIAGPETGLDSLDAAPIRMAVDPWGELMVIGPSQGLRFGEGAVGNITPLGAFSGWNGLAVAPRGSD